MKMLENVRSRWTQRQERKRKMREKFQTERAMNPIQKVVRHCARAVKPQPADFLREELDRIKAEHATTLPIEDDLRAQLNRRINALDIALACVDLPRTYMQLDLSFLRWDWGRRKYPRFAVFRTSGHALCALELSRHPFSGAPRVHGAPDFYCQAHEDLPRQWLGRGDNTVTLRCHFTGALPVGTRDRIKRATGLFNNEVFIVQDTHWKDWKAEKIRAPRDPLVFGMKSGCAWLIDQFDVTPVEDYILTTHVGIEPA